MIGPPELLAELTADAESGTPIAAMKQRWFALAAGFRFGGVVAVEKMTGTTDHAFARAACCCCVHWARAVCLDDELALVREFQITLLE